MATFSQIANNEQGVSVRGKLNNIGSDNEVAFRIVSQFSAIETEVKYWETGTTVFATAEKKWYKYNGATWEQNTDLPSLNYTFTTNIDNTDSPYSISTVEPICIVDTGAGDVTINLPEVASNSGLRYTIKNIGTGIVTVDGNGLETIDGSGTFDLYEDESLDIVSNGSGWFII